jgi:rhodanese-related sulfurtransferase
MSSYTTISVEDLKKRLDAGEHIHLIDVREDEEVAQGIIPGAIHLPLGQVPQRMEEIPREEEVIFICRSGYRSDQACQYLSSLGYTGTASLIGGMLAWVNLP